MTMFTPGIDDENDDIITDRLRYYEHYRTKFKDAVLTLDNVNKYPIHTHITKDLKSLGFEMERNENGFKSYKYKTDQGNIIKICFIDNNKISLIINDKVAGYFVLSDSNSYSSIQIEIIERITGEIDKKNKRGKNLKIIQNVLWILFQIISVGWIAGAFYTIGSRGI